jgi:hypothetical protein
MAKLPFLQFFPTNWRSDPALAMCSEGSRLLWFEMLLVMHEAEPRGFLVVNGRSPAPQQIAMLTRTDPGKVEERLAELAENGVFSRNRAGVIYSRKMVRDEKKAETARKNGSKGGNPTLRKTTDIPPSVILNGPEPISPKTLDSRNQTLEEETLTTVVGVSPPHAHAREEAPVGADGDAPELAAAVDLFCRDRRIEMRGVSPRAARAYVDSVRPSYLMPGQLASAIRQSLLPDQMNPIGALLSKASRFGVAVQVAVEEAARPPREDPIISGNRKSMADYRSHRMDQTDADQPGADPFLAYAIAGRA